MPIPDDKKEWLLGVGLTAEQIEGLESGLAKQAAAATDAGIESKETEEVAEPVAEADIKTETTEEKDEAPVATPEATVESEGEDETKDADSPESPNPLSRDEIAEAMKAVVVLVKESNDTVGNRLNDIEAQIKELQVSDESKVKERVEQIPTDSVLSLMNMSVIGHDGARVDGRTALAKEGPEETETTQAPRTPSPFIDALMSGAQVPVSE